MLHAVEVLPSERTKDPTTYTAAQPETPILILQRFFCGLQGPVSLAWCPRSSESLRSNEVSFCVGAVCAIYFVIILAVVDSCIGNMNISLVD
jgi:hypothetical protein